MPERPIPSGDLSDKPRRPDEAGLFCPERSPTDLLITGLIGCSSLLFFALCRYTNFDADEGIVLQGAQRVVEGQVPYRDFFSFYMPGHYYLTAFLFKAFGSSLLVARLQLVLCAVLFSALTYLIARRTCARWIAILATFAMTATCLPARFIVTHWDSTLVADMALYSGIRWLEAQGRGWGFAAGSFVALAILFEQSTGFGVSLGIVSGASLIWLCCRSDRFQWPLLRWAVLGFIWPFAGTIAYFGAHHGFRVAISDWLWPVFHYSAANHTSYGYSAIFSHEADIWNSGWIARIALLVTNGPLITIPLLPLLATASLAWLIVPRSPNTRDFRWQHRVFVSAFCAALLISVLMSKRPDFVHLDYLAPIFYIVLGWMLQKLSIKSQRWRAVATCVSLYVVISSAAFGVVMLAGLSRAHGHLTTIRGAITIDAEDQSLDVVQRNVTPGEKMFVYPYQPLYNYLTGTLSPSRYDFLEPGMHTAEQFEDALRSLTADRTRVVLLDTTLYERLRWISPNAPKTLSPASDPVIQYIFANYRKCDGPITNQYWAFLVMIRNDLPCARHSDVNN